MKFYYFISYSIKYIIDDSSARFGNKVVALDSQITIQNAGLKINEIQQDLENTYGSGVDMTILFFQPLS